jgi:GH15 family glucan-1,4-alpha-glucosidase
MEWNGPWPGFEGYEGSRPVRIGNDAMRSSSSTVYGEVLDAIHQARRGGLAPSCSAWDLEVDLLNHLEAIWQQPDQSIWETRGGPQQFTYSKIMCWVGFDRAVKTMTGSGLPGQWSTGAGLPRRSTTMSAGTALAARRTAYGGKELDASLLLLPALGFLPASDPRVRGTVEAIERELVVGGLVMRYDTASTEDGLPAGEGVFLPCSFWLVDAYALMGRFEAACELFERLLAPRNDVGLLSEEYDTSKRRLVGNFPEAFSHLAQVNSAYTLSTLRSPRSPSGNDRRRAPDEVEL